MAKRSPILGYNHNVRYRGLVFHVQTEDSGLQSPHLFTHLFKGGVIVATRKLVYDVGAVEDVIKNLMQAQHKAVLKELKRGGFDDKIDEYLGNTEGLLPRGARNEAAAERPSGTDISAPIELVDAPSEPIELVNPIARTNTGPAKPTAEDTPAARTITASRTGASRAALQPPPPSPGDEPTLTDDAGAVAAAVAASTAATIPIARTLTGRTTTPQTPPRTPTPVPMPARTASSSNSGVTRTPNARAATPPPIPSRNGTSSRPAIPVDDFDVDSSPDIEISLEPEDAIRGRSPRDTAVEAMPEAMGSTGDTGAHPAHGRQNTDSAIPPLPPAPSRADRPASHGAATLPPMARPARPPTRPSVAPPTVMTRAVPTEDGRARRDSEVIEVYAPAPPSAEAPPGERSERPGQYIVNRTKPNANQSEAIPSGLGRPRKDHPTGPIVTFKSNATSTTQPLPKPKVPSAMPPVPKSGPNPDNLTARPATPATRPPATPAPAAPRTSSPGSSGVITTRTTVIVGAPQRPTPAPKVRKAREEEGRGFGQGLISEKSLDEVILAYLSEDAEDK